MCQCHRSVSGLLVQLAELFDKTLFQVASVTSWICSRPEWGKITTVFDGLRRSRLALNQAATSAKQEESWVTADGDKDGGKEIGRPHQ